MSAALVLIDFQLDFLNAPGLEPCAETVVAAASALLDETRRRGDPVFHVRTTVRRDDDRRMPHWKRAGKWSCVEGTEGHAFAPALAPAEGEPVFDKTFYGAFGASGFEAALREAEMQTVVVAGVHFHACVRQTVLEAYERGFDVVVAEHAVASDDPIHAAATRRWLSERGIGFTPVVAKIRFPAARETAPLVDLAARLEAEAPSLAVQMAVDIGKPVRYGVAEVEWAAALVRRAASLSPGRRRPHGLVAIITPWNNPVGIPLGKIAPALALGNTVVWKPAPLAESIAVRLADMLPVQLVLGGAEMARVLMEDERVRAISLTGGTAAGRAAQEIAARRYVPLQAELGGNNAAIVWSDTDLARAAADIAEAGFAQAGQRCTANRRVVVDAGCADAFVDLLVNATAALVVGDPADPATHVGPLVTSEARDRVHAAIERARPAARSVHVPHGRVPDVFVAPTIIECDDGQHEIVREELFGPVIVVQRAESFDHALALANGTRHGLVASLFSASSARRERFLEEADAGILKLDRATAGADVDAPFGGWKASGIGPAEHGEGDVEFYTRAQAIYD